MKIKSTITALLLATVVSSPTLSTDKPEGFQLAESLFHSIDSNGDGKLTYTNMIEFGSDVFVSMDYDEDGFVVYSEFSEWGFGMDNIAENTGRIQGLEVAKKFVFDLWDRNNDDRISPVEQERAVVNSTDYADLNGDRLLSKQEYLQGFITNIGFRSALRQDQ